MTNATKSASARAAAAGAPAPVEDHRYCEKPLLVSVPVCDNTALRLQHRQLGFVLQEGRLVSRSEVTHRLMNLADALADRVLELEKSDAVAAATHAASVAAAAAAAEPALEAIITVPFNKDGGAL